MRNKIYLIFFMILPLFVFGQKGKIQGRVFDAKNNEPLPFTNIIIYNTNVGSTSDLDGNFIFTGVDPGFIRLAVSSVGYETFITEEILITNAKTAFIEIPMKSTSVEVQEFVVKATPFKIKKESPVSLRTLSIGEIEKSPGGNRDISKVIQSFPGVASTPAARNDIIVRGGGASENRFYLDGIEIPNINHFATQGASGGPTGIINVDFIREVDFYSGAFPAKYGNAMSSILDLSQKEGNKDKTSFRGSVGATDLALTLDGPLSSNTTYIVSVRRSYLQFLFDVIGLPFLPTYSDYQFKVKTQINDKSSLTFVGLGALDQFRLNLGLENPSESQAYILGFLPVNEQWNYMTGVNYKVFRKKSVDNFYLSRNMLNNRSYKFKDNNEDSLQLLDYVSQEIENKFRYENSREVKGYSITAGAGVEYDKYNNATVQQIVFGTILNEINYQSSLKLFKWNAFGQISKAWFKDRLSTSLGIRMDANSYSKEMSNLLDQFSPRFSLSYLLIEKVYLNFNTGRYFQAPAYTTMGYEDSIGSLVNKNNGLKYLSADHIVSGIEYRPDLNTKVTLEGFYKHYRNYPFSVKDSIALASKGADYGTFGDEEVLPIGTGRAFGAELLVQEKDFKGLNFILSYTFVRSEFKDFSGKYVPSAWDNRHLLNFILRKSFKKNWDIGLKWRFVGGSPYTPYDLKKSSFIPFWNLSNRGYLDYSKFNTLRFKPFHQLDIRIDKDFYFDKWTLILYVDVQNVYNFKAEQQPYLTNKDTEGNIQYGDPGYYQLRAIDSYAGTVLPSIGIIVEL